MASSFFFYDLETSGFNPKEARIMQFAGQRTDLQLQPIGEPHNYLVRLTDDVLPNPGAILVTGITPQKTITEGVSEAEFLKIFHKEIAAPDTIFVGYNTVRFDDEFMRYTMYRNFYDPYEWQWQNGRSRWDILDVVRMTRALRPEGIQWPFDSKGNPTNRLELLSSLNKLDHPNAHDALSDVNATIAVASLIHDKQPKLFDFLLQLRDKKLIPNFVASNQLFVYTSGKYAGEFEKTTVVTSLTEHPQGQGVLVFDLRYDPTPFVAMDSLALADAMRRGKDDPGPRLPVKTLKFNRCPAIAPLSVLDDASQVRLKLNPNQYLQNYDKLQKVKKQLVKGVLGALEILDKKLQAHLFESESDVEARLYDSFLPAGDKPKLDIVHSATAENISALDIHFTDARLEAMLPLYKARNYPKSMTDEDRAGWEQFREHKLMSGGQASRAAKYFAELAELADSQQLTQEQRYLLEELQLYGQSILPANE